MLNTAGGLPVVSAKGRQDLTNLIELNKRNIDNTPTHDSVRAHRLVEDELVPLRLRIYLQPETRAVASKIMQIILGHDDYLIPLNALRCETLFLWK